MNQNSSRQPNDVIVSRSMRGSTVLVKGYAFIPVEIALPVFGKDMTDEEAMKTADEFFQKIPTALKGYVVSNSADESAVFDFKASSVERMDQ